MRNFSQYNTMRNMKAYTGPSNEIGEAYYYMDGFLSGHATPINPAGVSTITRLNLKDISFGAIANIVVQGGAPGIFAGDALETFDANNEFAGSAGTWLGTTGIVTNSHISDSYGMYLKKRSTSNFSASGVAYDSSANTLTIEHGAISSSDAGRYIVCVAYPNDDPVDDIEDITQPTLIAAKRVNQNATSTQIDVTNWKSEDYDCQVQGCRIDVWLETPTATGVSLASDPVSFCDNNGKTKLTDTKISKIQELFPESGSGKLETALNSYLYEDFGWPGGYFYGNQNSSYNQAFLKIKAAEHKISVLLNGLKAYATYDGPNDIDIIYSKLKTINDALIDAIAIHSELINTCDVAWDAYYNSRNVKQEVTAEAAKYTTGAAATVAQEIVSIATAITTAENVLNAVEAASAVYVSSANDNVKNTAAAMVADAQAAAAQGAATPESVYNAIINSYEYYSGVGNGDWDAYDAACNIINAARQEICEIPDKIENIKNAILRNPEHDITKVWVNSIGSILDDDPSITDMVYDLVPTQGDDTPTFTVCVPGSDTIANKRAFARVGDLGCSWGDLSKLDDSSLLDNIYDEGDSLSGEHATRQVIYFGTYVDDNDAGAIKPLRFWIAGREYQPNGEVIIPDGVTIEDGIADTMVLYQAEGVDSKHINEDSSGYVGDGKFGDELLHCSYTITQLGLTKVNFDYAAEGVAGPEYLLYKDAYYYLPWPVRYGYSFVGWFTQNGEPVTPGMKLIEGIDTLIAHWEEKEEYIIPPKEDDTGGTITQPDEPLPPPPQSSSNQGLVQTGYTYTGGNDEYPPTGTVIQEPGQESTVIFKDDIVGSAPTESVAAAVDLPSWNWGYLVLLAAIFVATNNGAWWYFKVFLPKRQNGGKMNNVTA